MKNEMVLVTETDLLNKIGINSSCDSTSISTPVDLFITTMLTNRLNWKFVNREMAEKDFSLRQIIPYVILNKENKIFSYTRSNKSGEQRLVEKVSIGLGGHVNPKDLKPKNINFLTLCGNAVKRELKEEIGCYNLNCLIPTPAALIQDDSNDVGKVHLGLLYFVDIDFYLKMKNLKYEKTIQNPEFKTIGELLNVEDKMESWSKISLHMLLNCTKVN